MSDIEPANSVDQPGENASGSESLVEQTQLDRIEQRIEQLIESHNTIGLMFQGAVDAIRQTVEMVQSQGIGGLMGMMKGQNNGGE